MNITLERDVLSPDFTLGQLSVDGLWACYTVEDCVRPVGEKIHGKTAIPAGRYKIIITPSPRFKRPLPLLVGVRGFDGIRIHPGNSSVDTEGCILPGRTRTANGVGESRLAFEALYAEISEALQVGEEVWIEITQPKGQS